MGRPSMPILAIAKKALDTYGTPEIRQLLETTGLGNNPEMIRFFWRVGKTLTEDGTVTGSTGANGIRTFDEAAKKTCMALNKGQFLTIIGGNMGILASNNKTLLTWRKKPMPTANCRSSSNC